MNTNNTLDRIASSASALGAAELDTLIRRLALMRADLTPAVPATRGGLADTQDVLIENGQGMTIALRTNGDFRLWLRHRGLGWLAWEIDARTARGMADYIVNRTVSGPDIDLIGDHGTQPH